MTLDEAIIHCKEIAQGDCACAEDHRQLANWLEELQKRQLSVCENCAHWISGLEIKDDFIEPRCSLRPGIWHHNDHCSSFDDA